MTPKVFSNVDEILEHCRRHGARMRDVVTDLHRDPPRIYLVCHERTFMIRPDVLLELQHHHLLPPDITNYFIERRLLPVTSRAYDR